MLIDGALRAAMAAPVEEIVVVTGADPKVVAAAEAYADPRVRLVHAEDYAKGLSASLKAGVAALSPGIHGVFIFLGDMPRIPHDVFEPLRDAIANGAPAAAPAFGGARGHPVILASPLFGMLMELQGDNGANGILNALGRQVRTVPWGDDGVLFDVDVRQ